MVLVNLLKVQGAIKIIITITLFVILYLLINIKALKKIIDKEKGTIWEIKNSGEFNKEEV